MTDEPISKEELEHQNGRELPDREAMSVIQPFPEPGLPPPRD